MITREQIEEIQAESREKGISIKRVLQEKGIPEHQYFCKVSIDKPRLLGLPGSGYLCIKDLLAMMTKEEVAQICTQTGRRYRRRVPTIGIRRIFSSQSHKACQIKERKTKELPPER